MHLTHTSFSPYASAPYSTANGGAHRWPPLRPMGARIHSPGFNGANIRVNPGWRDTGGTPKAGSSWEAAAGHSGAGSSVAQSEQGSGAESGLRQAESGDASKAVRDATGHGVGPGWRCDAPACFLHVAGRRREHSLETLVHAWLYNRDYPPVRASRWTPVLDCCCSDLI
jgi:hypothetical protein